MPTETTSPMSLSDAREVMLRAFAALRVHLTTVHESVRHAHALGGVIGPVVYAALDKERAEVEAAFATLNGILWREAGGK